MNAIVSRFSLAALLTLIVCGIALIPVQIVAQGGSKLDAAGLKNMIVGLGYTVKDLNTEKGKEKISIDIKTQSFNIPVGAEISPSGNYVWLTVNLGDSKTISNFGERAINLLRQNGKIQPNFFYLTSVDSLMMAVPADNRSLTPADLRRLLEKLVKDVDSTSQYWSK